MIAQEDQPKISLQPETCLLVAEHDPALLEALEHNLSAKGHRVLTANHGLTALELARKARPDLIVLDATLPGLDGLELCRILRRETAVPIVILTARESEADRVLGPEVGADDYLTRPFGMRELLARVRALLRRTRRQREAPGRQGPPPPTERLVFGDLSIDLDRREVWLDGVPLPLNPKEFELLCFLARHKGTALPRDLILSRVWGWDCTSRSRTLDVHIRRLRQKIEPAPARPQRIVTVKGVGYRFDG